MLDFVPIDLDASGNLSIQFKLEAFRAGFFSVRVTTTQRHCSSKSGSAVRTTQPPHHPTQRRPDDGIEESLESR